MSHENYAYPLDIEWSKAQMVTVINFFVMIEQAYTQGVLAANVLTQYEQFKTVIPAISEQKQRMREFEQESGFASFPVIQAARKATQKTVRMKVEDKWKK